MQFSLDQFYNGKGLRGIHVFIVDGDRQDYRFVPWNQAIPYLKQMGGEIEDNFTKMLANYDPDTSALTMIHDNQTQKIRLDLYSLPSSVI